MAATMTSCVSKKKFEELARAKRMSDREIAALQGEKQALEEEMRQLKADFNAARYQLTLNNAAKDKQIDDLSARLRALENKESALKTELQDAHEQAKNRAQSKESELAALQEEVKAAQAERDRLRKELSEYKTNAEWDNRQEALSKIAGTFIVVIQNYYVTNGRDCDYWEYEVRTVESYSRSLMIHGIENELADEASIDDNYVFNFRTFGPLDEDSAERFAEYLRMGIKLNMSRSDVDEVFDWCDDQYQNFLQTLEGDDE